MNHDPTMSNAFSRLAAIVDSSEDAIVSTTLAGDILTWNRAAEQMYGYAESELMGRHIFVLLPSDRHEEMACHLERIARGQRVPRHDSVRLAKTGSTVHVAVTMSPIHDHRGDVVGASIIDRDVTEQRWIAATLDGTLKALEAAVAEAQEAAAASRRFLADAAHQLRSPIAGAQASVEGLLRGADPPERERLFLNLVGETARAGRLVASLLRIAHLDEGQTLFPKPCDLVALATDEADRTWALAPRLDIALHADLAPDRQPELDPEAVREILANLLDNARRYAVERIDVSLASSDAGMEVRVADDGPGLPAGMEEQAFERFVSLDPQGGSGLGLAIARSLARAHGGELTWEESGFVLRLPLAR